MIGDKSLYLLATGEAGLVAAFSGWLRMVTPSGRRQYRRFATVSAGFVALLAEPEPDEPLRLEVRRSSQAKRLVRRLAVLGLGALLVSEYAAYAAPLFTQWFHHC